MLFPIPTPIIPTWDPVYDQEVAKKPIIPTCRPAP